MPNLGLYLDRPALGIPERGMQDCLNVRVNEGEVANTSMGWETFPVGATALNLDDNPCLLIDEFFTRDGSRILIFGTDKDLYYFDDPTSTLKYITPRYETGQVDVVNASTTVTENGCDFEAAGVKAGDKVWIGDSAKVDQAAGWYTVDSVPVLGTTLELTEPYTGATATEDYTIRLLFTGDLERAWSTETFPDAQPQDEDTWYGVNGPGNQVVKWNGSDDQVEEFSATLGLTAGWLRRYKDMLLYGDLTVAGEDRQQAIRNSDISSPEVVDGTGVSGEFVSSAGVDRILAMELLADIVVAYHERSINLLQYVGPPLNFLIRTAIPGVGPIAGRAIANFGDFHEFVGPDTGYRFDGVTLTEHGGHVFREGLRTIDPNRYEQAIAHLDEENGEVLWILPLTTDSDIETGGPERAFSEHYLEPVEEDDPTPMAIREIPATATGHYLRSSTIRFEILTSEQFDQYDFRWNDRYFFASFPFNLFGTVDGDLFVLGTANSQNGGSFSSYARFGAFQVVDGRRKGIIKRIEPAVKKRPEALAADFEVTLRSADFPHGDYSISAETTFDIQHAQNRFVSLRKAALYADIQFGSEGVNKPWSMLGYAVEVIPAGER